MSALRNDPPLRKCRYVQGKQLFEELGDGRVRVICDDGREGLFTWDGHYIEGELTTTNEHMLRYVGGPDLPRACNFKWTILRAAPDRPSGWPEELEPYVAHQMGNR